MRPSTTRPADPDLTSCEREPIQFLGAIQSFGFLLAVDASWTVTRASENIDGFMGVTHDQVVGAPLETCVSPSVLHDIRGRLQLAAGPGVVERLFGQRPRPEGALFDIAVHQSGDEIVMEFERADTIETAVPAVLRTIFRRVEQQRTPRDLCVEAARQMRALTGFDRVMVYRFDADGAGQVVAESARRGLTPFLNLRYPATDIPAQARVLYERNTLRVIFDVASEPVPVSPALSPAGVPLDMSMSVLRSVSPIHIEYLRNMGVGASMSVSILRSGKLWGLIACHHGEAIHLDLHKRSMAELFGQMFSYLLETRERQAEAAQEERLQAMQHRIATTFSVPNATLKDFALTLGGVGGYIAADGIGTYQSGEITLTGTTPTREEFLGLLRFLNKTAPAGVYATHHLAAVFPPAADYAMRAAGLLSLPLSRPPRDYVVFFRRELVQTITWAGEPVKPQSYGPNGPRLTPRKSFEAWVETVRNQSEPWSPQEMRAAEALRATMVELVLQIAELNEKDRQASRQRQEVLIAELNHRVRNILGLVRGLIKQTAAHATDVPGLVNGLGERIRSLARAYDLLSISSWRPGSLNGLLRAEVEAYEEGEGRLRFGGLDVMLQPKAFSTMALVVHEAMTNARKYGALSAPGGWISVETSSDEIGNVTIQWREIGGPAVTPPSRRGFGTTILEQAIPFELSGGSDTKFLPSGLVITFVLPAAIAECVHSPQTLPSGTIARDAPSPVALGDHLRYTLLVEDNMFVALDAEDMLRQMGAETVDIAKTVQEAVDLLREGHYGFALLDVNLGEETSAPVAHLLLEKNIPFLFGTGYGEAPGADAALTQVPIVSKPYHPETFAEAIEKLLFSRAQGD